MTRTLAFALIAVLMGGVAIQYGQAGVPEVTPDGSLISGRVLSEGSGTPIGAALVRLEVDGRLAGRVRTDEAGRYEFEHSAVDGLGRIRVWADGYIPDNQLFRIECVPPADDRSVCVGAADVYLQGDDALFKVSARECSLEGIVLKEDQTPARGSRVSLEDGVIRAETDGAGEFLVSGVRSGLRTVTIGTIGALRLERMVLVACDADGGRSQARFQVLSVPVSIDTTIATGSWPRSR